MQTPTSGHALAVRKTAETSVQTADLKNLLRMYQTIHGHALAVLLIRGNSAPIAEKRSLLMQIGSVQNAEQKTRENSVLTAVQNAPDL